MKGGNFEPNEESRRAELQMGRRRTHVWIVVSRNQPTWVIGWVQNGHGERPDSSIPDPGCIPKV